MKAASCRATLGLSSALSSAVAATTTRSCHSLINPSAATSQSAVSSWTTVHANSTRPPPAVADMPSIDPTCGPTVRPANTGPIRASRSAVRCAASNAARSANCAAITARAERSHSTTRSTNAAAESCDESGAAGGEGRSDVVAAATSDRASVQPSPNAWDRNQRPVSNMCSMVSQPPTFLAPSTRPGDNA